MAPETVAAETGLTTEQVAAAMRDVAQKRMTTHYLHLGPQLVQPVPLALGVEAHS